MFFFAPLADEKHERSQHRHVVSTRCCGMGVHKKMLVACVSNTQVDDSVPRQMRTFSTMTANLLACLDWLESLPVEIVAIESTGASWMPVAHELGKAFVEALIPHRAGRDDPPALLTRCGRACPAVGVLRDILISPGMLTCAAMQRPRSHLGRRKDWPGEGGQETRGDDPRAGNAHPALLFRGRMGGHNAWEPVSEETVSAIHG